MSSCEPEYDPDEVERLARAGRIDGTHRVMSWLANHEYDAKSTLMEVLGSVASTGTFTGTVRLKNDCLADEYVVRFEDEAWYVKFYIDGGMVRVQVWSCKWDGVAS